MQDKSQDKSKEKPLILSVESILFDPAIYPRKELSQDYIDYLAGLMDDGVEFDPIEVDQNMRVLDGRNRFEAHKTRVKKFISATVTQVADNAEAFRIACQRNAKHGKQFTREERRDNVRKMYLNILENNSEQSVIAEEVIGIASTMGINRATVYRLIKDISTENISKKEATIIETIMKAPDATQAELAQKAGVTQSTISRRIKEQQRTSATPRVSSINIQLSPQDRSQFLLGIGSEEFLEKMEFNDSEEDLEAAERIIEQDRQETEQYGMLLSVFEERLASIQKDADASIKGIKQVSEWVAVLLMNIKDATLRERISLVAESVLKVSEKLRTVIYMTAYRPLDEGKAALDAPRKGKLFSLPGGGGVKQATGGR